MVLVRPELPLTPSGERELVLEVACLECLRHALVAEWEGAADVSLRALRNELAAVSSEIGRLRLVLAGASRVGDSSETVAIGCEVTVASAKGDRSYAITGPLAADHHSGRISFESPLARALLGRPVGEVVEVDLGRGVEQLTVIAVTSARVGTIGGFNMTGVANGACRAVIRETDTLREVLRRYPAALRVLLRRGVPASLAENSVAEAAKACGIRTSMLLAELQAAVDQSCFAQAT